MRPLDVLGEGDFWVNRTTKEVFRIVNPFVRFVGWDLSGEHMVLFQDRDGELYVQRAEEFRDRCRRRREKRQRQKQLPLASTCPGCGELTELPCPKNCPTRAEPSKKPRRRPRKKS